MIINDYHILYDYTSPFTDQDYLLFDILDHVTPSMVWVITTQVEPQMWILPRIPVLNLVNNIVQK